MASGVHETQNSLLTLEEINLRKSLKKHIVKSFFCELFSHPLSFCLAFVAIKP
jgi:hypothetical protein